MGQGPTKTPCGIAVHDLKLAFVTTNGLLPVLDDISFDVPPGHTLALVGPSGCGKTSLLRVLAGMDMGRKTPLVTSGTVTIGGMQPCQALQDKITALVPQSPALLPWRTVFENVMLPFEIANATTGNSQLQNASERTLADLRRVGLSEFQNSLPIELSGGMQSRVAIVRAIVRRPQVMLLDEPLGALDEITRQHLQHEIDEIFTDLHCTTVLVTHSVHEAVFLADHILTLSSRPAGIVKSYEVKQQRPRSTAFGHSPEFRDLVREITENLDRSFTAAWRG